MKFTKQIATFLENKKAFQEVVSLTSQIEKDYKTVSKENIAKVIFNQLSKLAKEYYSFDNIYSMTQCGFETVPMYLAINRTEELLASGREKWNNLSFFSKLMLGAKPSRKGIATWCLINKDEILRKLELIEGYNISELIGCNLYLISSGIQDDMIF